MTVEGFRSWVDRQSAVDRATTRETRARTAAGVLAFAGLAAIALVRVGLNLPFDLPLSGVYGPASVLATLGPALGLFVWGVQAERPVHRAGLVFAGVFGLLTLVAQPAELPATVALGTAIVALAGVQMAEHWRTTRYDRLLVIGVLALGAVLSLAAGLGFDPATLRPLGSRVVLLSVAATPVFVDWDREGLLVGLGAGVAILAMGVSVPFVTGAVSLVVGGVVGASLPLLFLGTVGAVVVLWSGLRAGRTDLALAAGILLVAGVPATVPRGMGVLAAIALFGGDGR